MRTSKSILAGVAAGALGLALVPILGVTSANAASVTGTTSPVRAGSVGSIPAATLSFAKTTTLPTTLSVVSAPTAAAIIRINNGSATPASGDDSATLVAADSSLGAIFGTASGDDSTIGLSADTAGSYTARLSNGTDTVTFSFTTTGAPTSLTLAPATQTVLVGATATLTATLKDASGNVTQPAVVDSVALSENTDDTLSTASLTSSNLATGVAEFTLTTTGNPAGTTTITGTPQGTLPATGVTAATASVVKSGTVSSTTVKSITVQQPVKQVAGGTAPSTSTTAVPEGTTSVTVLVDDTTTATAGNTIRLKAVLSAGTLNGSATLTQYTDVTTNASKQATATFTIGGAGILNAANLVVSQVNVANAAVSPAAQNTITQVTAAVSSATITISPDDSQVAAIGAVTPVTVTVKDQYGDPQAGWTVQAFRGTTSGTFLTQGTTNALGVASVSVTNAAGIVSGTTENYSIKAYIGAITPVTDNNTLSIAYTTNGGITGLSVAVAGGGTTPITNATTSIAVLPYQVVPYAGTAGTATTGTYTVSSGAGTATGNVTGFTPTATPANNVTVTVPAGVKVSTTASTAWSGGSQTVTVSSGTAVYVFATKTGEHDVTFTSGGLTTTAKIKVATPAAAAYDIAITPAAQTLAKGGFGTATVKLTDVFGNAVPGDAVNAVTVTAAGEVLLGGYNATQNVTVAADGSGTITVIAGNTAGAGTLTVVPASTSSAAAWASGYTPPTGASAPKVSAVGAVTVGESPASKSITITGSRTTVSGKPGIMVDGVTTGLDDGKTVIPYVRFPGGEYTQGTARPAISGGAFEWTRKTGKKSYVYFTNDDGAVKSNSVIIAAN